MVLARRRFDWAGALRRHGWLLALLAYMLVSTLWSDITLIALRRWVREAIVLDHGTGGHVRSPIRAKLSKACLRRSAYILIPFSLMLIKYYPALGVDYGRWSGEQMWIGVTRSQEHSGSPLPHQRILPALGAVSPLAGPGASGRAESVVADASVLLIALFLLKGAENAYSATSIGTFALGIATSSCWTWLRALRLPVPAIVPDDLVAS